MSDRLRANDVLADMHMELCLQALRLTPYDADARVTWLHASRQLLDAVPERYQRLAWAIQLSTAFALTCPGLPIQSLMGELMGERNGDVYES